MWGCGVWVGGGVWVCGVWVCGGVDCWVFVGGWFGCVWVDCVGFVVRLIVGFGLGLIVWGCLGLLWVWG